MTSDNEHLLRDAKTLVSRVELVMPGFVDPVIVGFRQNGSASFYFGADSVYQFNSNGELRRVFRAGRLVKADALSLVELVRDRTESQVRMKARYLSPVETADILRQVQRDLQILRQAIQSGTSTVVGEVSSTGDVLTMTVEWLQRQTDDIRIANGPHA